MIKCGMCREDDGVSDHLKVFIQQDDVTVIGYIGDGASKSLSSQWGTPFENDTAGQASGRLEKVADIIQLTTGKTSKTVMNTAMIWDGINPFELSLPLYFKAYKNARLEVNDPIMFLEQFASPQLMEGNVANEYNAISSGTAAMGTIPRTCSVNIGRRIIFKNCVILDVSSELDTPKTKQGYMTRNLVQLQIRMDRMTNRSEIQSLYK